MARARNDCYNWSRLLIYMYFIFLYETWLITVKSYKSFMTLYDYQEKWISRTHRWVTLVYFNWLNVIVVTIRLVYNYFKFLYENGMVTGKSYKSYMTFYDYRGSYMTFCEIKESCLMGNLER